MRIAAACLMTIACVGVVYSQYRVFRSPVLLDERSNSTAIITGLIVGDSIPAIREPVFESVATADQYLDNKGLGLLITSRARARFYPYQILVWHEAVNDTFAGRDILVSYSPLTFTNGVYDRTFSDGAAIFSLSGKVADSITLFVDDATGSLWNQATGEAIDGKSAGERLPRLESAVVSWSIFKEGYPNGDVLSRDTGFDRDYTQNPYEGYDTSDAIWFPLSREDGRLGAKTVVYGIVENENAKAYLPEAYETFHSRVEPTLFTTAYWFAWVAMYPETEIVLK